MEAPFLVSGMEFALVSGRHRLETWFVPYPDGAFGLGDPVGICSVEVEVRPNETVELTRTQLDWETCAFAHEATAAWDIEVRQEESGTRGSSWSLRLYDVNAERSSVALEYALPSFVSAVYLRRLRTRAPARPLQLVLAKEPDDSGMRACNLKMTGCEDLGAMPICEVVVSEEMQAANARTRVTFDTGPPQTSGRCKVELRPR